MGPSVGSYSDDFAFEAYHTVNALNRRLQRRFKPATFEVDIVFPTRSNADAMATGSDSAICK